MRVHRLELEAFGPFVERQVVDVDALAAQHLFLLHGETGAGKTTVLDALCFGLYGEVPGVRQGAGHLRSDHAAPDAEPRVALEVTVRGRRLRLVRTPKWQRPKKRGSGTTTAQASVTLSERVDGEWVHLSSRIDETNQLVGGLVGLTPGQFCQVVMLPQGQFASFLRAGSDERRGLLQKIFATGRFADVERWLVERRIQARRDSEEHHNGLRSLVARFTEAAGQPWPEEWPVDDLSLVAASGEVTEHAADLLDDAARQVEATRAHATLTEQTEVEVRERCEAAVHLAAEVARAGSAREVLRDLDRRADHLSGLAAQHEAALRARPVAEARRAADRGDARHTQAARTAATAHATASAALRRHGGEADHDGESHSERRAVAALEAAHRRRAEAAALVPAQHDVAEADTSTRGLAEQVATRLATVHGLEQSAAALPERRRAVTADIARVRPLAADAGAARLGVQAAAERLQAAREALVHGAQLEQSRRRVQVLTQQAQDLRETYLDCRERRIEGMAGELALGLAVGQDCPVCGSHDHPSPAGRGVATESQQTEDEARRASEDAAVSAQAAEQDVVRLRSHLDHATAASGGLDVPAATTEHQRAVAALERCQTAVADLTEHEARLADLEDEQVRHAEELASARSGLAATEASHAASRERAEGIRRTLRESLVGFSGDDVPATDAPDSAEVWRDRFDRHVEQLQALVQALDEVRAARTAAEEATSRLHEVAVDAGFASPEAAAAAVVDPTRLAAVADEVTRAAQQRHAAESTLSGIAEEVRAVLEGTAPAPEPGAVREHLAVATRACREAASVASAAGDRRRRLEGLAGELAARLGAWAPVREHHRVLADLSATVEGKGGDNALQMRLSAYVLAARLSQVVAAANERLEGMAEQRYELEHTAFKGAGDRRGGLSLRVVDSWTGESRDPATLSGGETFVVALALALGLADVVTQEAGGAEIDTLFVDEGFGSLDPHTLDRVMDCLDDLRSGGRSVGVVSHVAELRSRIPDQLHVLKTARGSRVRACHGDTADAAAGPVGARG